jgi:hypothetical protein
MERIMKILSAAVLCSLMVAPADSLGADEKVDIEALRKELRDLRQRTEELERKLQALSTAPAQTNAPVHSPVPPGQPANITSSAEAALQPRPGGEAPASSRNWSPTSPITLMRAGGAYMNIGFDALLDAGTSTAPEPADYLQLGGHDPIQRGFSMPNTELTFDGAVDPYFTAFANFVLQLDRNNETHIEAEEVYFKTTSLPGNIQVKGGQYLASFGRQNPQHPHQWAFVDQPLILTRAFGPDGLRSIGADISWLAPTPFFSEFTLGILNGNGEQGFLFRNPGEPDAAGVDRFRGRATVNRPLRNPDDLLFVPRIAASFDITDEQTLLLGASGAFGPNNTALDARTEIYGADLYWKWKSPSAEKGFPFVAFQTEGLYSRFEAGADPLAGLRAENLYDYGFYSQLLWGFKPRWVAGFRGEWVNGNSGLDDPNDVFRNERTRLSPNLTWYPTEFSKIRLQYNFDRGELFGTDHSVWMQFEFQLGAHAPHKF